MQKNLLLVMNDDKISKLDLINFWKNLDFKLQLIFTT